MCSLVKAMKYIKSNQIGHYLKIGQSYHFFKSKKYYRFGKDIAFWKRSNGVRNLSTE